MRDKLYGNCTASKHTDVHSRVYDGCSDLHLLTSEGRRGRKDELERVLVISHGEYKNGELEQLTCKNEQIKKKKKKITEREKNNKVCITYSNKMTVLTMCLH